MTGRFATQFPLSKRLLGAFALGIALTACVAVVGIILGMLADFAVHGGAHITWEFLTEYPRNSNTEGGIFPALAGTTFLVLLMTLMGVPLGTITAVYLTEYARQGSALSKFIRFAVNTLAGVPSIVFALFGVGFFIQFVGKGLDAVTGASIFADGSLLWCSATLAILTLPVVIVSVEEALRSVPRELREASLALGATRLQTDKFMHLGYHLYVLATQSPDVEATLPLQYATTVVLLALTFTLNFGAIYLRSRLRKNR